MRKLKTFLALVKKRKPSQILFLISGGSLILFGFFYTFLWSIAPYHTDIIQMSVHELSANHPNITDLIVTLVDIVGFAFFSIGGISIYNGFAAFKERKAWNMLLYLFLTFFLPLTYVVYRVHGPIELTLLADAFFGFGLITSFFGQ